MRSGVGGDIGINIDRDIDRYIYILMSPYLGADKWKIVYVISDLLVAANNLCN